MVAKSASVERALRLLDPGLRLESESMRVEAVRGNDCKDEDYSESLRLSSGACAIAGYVAKQDFDVWTTQVSDAGTMVGVAGREGASSPKIDSFQLADRREARRQAIAAALADAKSKAQAIAIGSNAVLGKILSISLDGAAVRNDDIVVTGSRVKSRALAEAPVVVVVKPAPVETAATVTVSYAIN